MPIGYQDPLSDPDAQIGMLPLDTLLNPLRGAPPPELPLTDAPLVRVMAQVRFPLIASIEKQEFIGAFQEGIRQDYPVLRPQQSRVMSLGSEGVLDTRKFSAWRFADVENDWRLTLAPDFLTLETTAYESRDAFLQRWEKALLALDLHVSPGVVDRIGVRYIDQVVVEQPTQLASLVRPEVAGALATPLVRDARHAITESLLELPEEKGRVMARWGLVPAGQTVDPATMDSIEEASWLLDLDAFRVQSLAMDVAEIVRQTRAFAERIYSIFRWAVSDEFLRKYGGQP